MTVKKKYTQEDVDFVLMARDVKETKDAVTKINERLEKEYVTNDELQLVLKDIMPYIMVVKMFCGLIITAVLSAIVYLVVKR